MDGDDFILTPADLAATAEALGLAPGSLSMLPSGLVGGRRVDAGLAGPARERLLLLVRALAQPSKSGRLHHTVADQAVGRVGLAWHPGLGDEVATLTGEGAECRLGLRSAASLRLMAAQVLALDSAAEGEMQRIALGTPACLVWLAILDHLRRARLISMLGHVSPVEVFAPSDVSSRFEASKEEDFRWPLNFVARLTPLPLFELDIARDATPAFAELEAAHLIEKVSDGDTPVFELSPGGAAEADAILHDVTKLGIEVTAPSSRGVVADVALFIRSALRLHLFYLSAGESAFGALSGVGADNLLGHMLVPPQALEPPAAESQVPPTRRSDAAVAEVAPEPPLPVTGTLVRPPAARPDTAPRPGATGPPLPARKAPTEPVTLPPAIAKPTASARPSPLEPAEATLVPGASMPAPRGGVPETEGLVQLRPLLLAQERVGAPPVMVNLEEDSTIGRAAENRIALDDSGASRRHAALRRTKDGAWEIEDLESSNGTIVNDVRITNRTLLATGDRILIGRSILRVERAPAPVRLR